MKTLFVTLPSRCFGLAVLSVVAVGCSGGAEPPEPENSSDSEIGVVSSIPAAFMGMHVNRLASYRLKVPYGTSRGWASGAQWPNPEKCAAQSGDPADPCFTWSTLAAQPADVKAAGVNEVMFTLSRTPPWAVTPAEA